MTPSARRRLNENLAAYAFLGPATSILFVFWFLPVLLALSFSFFDMTALAPMNQLHFVGLAQYRRAFVEEDFAKSFWNTVNYVLYSVPPTLICALAAAMLLNSKVRGRTIFRTALFLPHITTWVAISIVWKYIFNRDTGLANWGMTWVQLHVLGFKAAEPLTWLSESRGVFEMLYARFVDAKFAGIPHLPLGIDRLLVGPSLSLACIVLTSVWRDIGYFMLIFLAGLQNIDRTLYEAAEIDGASPWAKFRTITWPLLSPVTFFMMVISMINAFKVFVPMLVMTPSGGPDYTTAPMVFYLYDKGFRGQWELSYASAVAYLLTLIILFLTLLQNKLFGGKVEYQQ